MTRRCRETQGGLLWVALVAGLTAAWSMQQHIQQRVAEVEAEANTPTELRLVAAVDLLPNDVLDATVVSTRAVPQDWIHQDGLLPDDFMTWEGASLLHGVRQGEQILSTYLGRTSTVPLAARLAPGRRAVTIAVDDAGAQAGLLEPGNRLDIFVSLNQSGGRYTTLLLQAARVLAVGNRAEGDVESASGFSTVTLDVSPPEAVRLIAARQVGSLNAVLSHDGAIGAGVSLVPLTQEVAIALGLAAAPKPVVKKAIPVLYGAGSSSPGLPQNSAENARRPPWSDSTAASLVPRGGYPPEESVWDEDEA